MDPFRFLVTSVFLPRVLPGAAPEHPFDGAFVRAMATTLRASARSSAAAAGASAVFSRWADLAGPAVCAEQLGAALAALRGGDVLPVYVAAQNAVLTVAPGRDADAAVGVFQVSAPNGEVTGAAGDLAARYPAVTVRVPAERVVGEGGEFARQLAALAVAPYEEQYPRATKGRSQGATLCERRDVLSPTFVTEWLLGVTAGCRVPATDGVAVAKKVRDTISWAEAELPWRRAGEWTAVKAVLHVWFVGRLGAAAGTDAYKAEMLALMAGALERARTELAADAELLLHMAAKVARRSAKLRARLGAPASGGGGSGGAAAAAGPPPAAARAHYEAVLTRAAAAVVAARAVLDARWTVAVADHAAAAAVALRATQLDFLPDTRLCLQTAEPHLRRALATPRSLTCPTPARPDCTGRVEGAPDAPYFPGFDGLREDDQTQALWDFEAWVTRVCLAQALETDTTVPDMRAMLEAYLKVASPFYAADPVGHSALVLTAFTLAAMMDAAACAQYPLLREHAPGVDVQFLTQLLLPHAEQLRQLSAVEAYFLGRDAVASGPALLATAAASADSFAVRFAKQDAGMRAARTRIVAQIEADVAAKHAEVGRARRKHEGLVERAAGLSCSYHTSRRGHLVHDYDCFKCGIQQTAAGMRESLYEKLLPDNAVQQLAVVYDLCVPRPLSHLADALYLLRRDVCGSESIKFCSESTWSEHHELSRWVTKGSALVKLGSATKPFGRSHYNSGLHPSSPLSDFVVPNGCNGVLCAPSTGCYATLDKAGAPTTKIVLTVPEGPYRMLQVRWHSFLYT